MLKYFTFIVSLFTLCFAGSLAPLEPAPGNVYTQGGPLSISWTADTTGAWKGTTIELMTGDNFDMRHLTTLAIVDGTNAANTSISVTCPSVTPHSEIYFLQFTAVGQAMWTGRFTIVGSDGATVPPSNTTQPDGSNIPWGIGMLVAPSFPGSPPPSTAPPGQIDDSGSDGSSDTSASTSSGSPNTTEGLNASSPSSTSTSSNSPSAPTSVGPLPGEMTSSVDSSSAPQPSSQSDQAPSTNTTTSPDANQTNANQNSAITATHAYPIMAFIPMLISTVILGANLF